MRERPPHGARSTRARGTLVGRVVVVAVGTLEIGGNRFELEAVARDTFDVGVAARLAARSIAGREREYDRAPAQATASSRRIGMACPSRIPTQATIPASRRRMISVGSRPSSARIASVCSPCSGAIERGAQGVPPKSTGVAGSSVVPSPSGTSTKAPAAAAWGWRGPRRRFGPGPTRDPSRRRRSRPTRRGSSSRRWRRARR